MAINCSLRSVSEDEDEDSPSLSTTAVAAAGGGGGGMSLDESAIVRCLKISTNPLLDELAERTNTQAADVCRQLAASIQAGATTYLPSSQCYLVTIMRREVDPSRAFYVPTWSCADNLLPMLLTREAYYFHTLMFDETLTPPPNVNVNNNNPPKKGGSAKKRQPAKKKPIILLPPPPPPPPQPTATAAAAAGGVTIPMMSLI